MKVFVTGGTGFLGMEIIRFLLNKGHDVVSYSRKKCNPNYPKNAKHYQGDILDYKSLIKAMKGCEAVFHTASKVDIWGDYDTFYNVNVVGTENIIKACLNLQISNLVYTSTASVVYNGNSEGKNESIPYPKKFNAFYPKTKAIAEQKILNANSDRLRTCSIRPHLIWGPRDPHILPGIIKKQNNGQLRLLSKGEHFIDNVFVTNAALAHVQILYAMMENPSLIGGKAYFISQDQPIRISDFINKLLNAADLPPVKKTINKNFALFLGWFFQTLFRILKLKSEPPITLFIAQQFSSSHWYNISAAKRDFGYSPIISIDQGMEKLKTWIENETTLDDMI